MRADAELSSLPFIMITAESKTENVVAAKEAGVNNYIVKPFNADTLRSKISAVLVREQRESVIQESIVSTSLDFGAGRKRIRASFRSYGPLAAIKESIVPAKEISTSLLEEHRPRHAGGSSPEGGTRFYLQAIERTKREIATLRNARSGKRDHPGHG